jgi:NADPH:quinone reductase-like Zn-dependent oxidoreductase
MIPMIMMRAAVTPSYGPPSVLVTRDVRRPSARDDEVVIEVRATTVTAGDIRLRAADFPSISALPGRLMMGVLRPKNPVQGTMFAGRVVEVGGAVTRYAIGDDVFGSTGHGAYAEYLSMRQGGTMAKMPAKMAYHEAAAVPYGGVTALRFLRDVGSVRRGDKVLVVGAAGGVGCFAVQVAKHLGAEVTAVCSRRSFELVRGLGADHVVDYATEAWTESGQRYDVIFDTAGVTSFGSCRSSLTRDGRYMTLILSVGLLLQVALTAIFGGRRAKFAVAFGDHRDMDHLRELVERGVVRPVIAQRFPLERIAEAHAAAETRPVHGSVVVTSAAPR